MPENIIEQACVRISLLSDKTVIKQGSGVLIASSDSFYVLTACHCLGDSMPELEDILIEKQNDFRSEFENIKVVRIVKYEVQEDWALLEIDFDDEDKFLNKHLYGCNFVREQPVKFCGYQKVSSSGYRPFNAKVLTIDNDSAYFQINLTDNTFDQGGEEGKTVAEGLSGSGVFIIRNKIPYLVGILNSVKTKKAWNDDIDCKSIDCLKELVEDFTDLSDENLIKIWEENLEKEITSGDIAAFRATNEQFFINIDRKNKVIHDSDEKAATVTTRKIKSYLAFQYKMNQIEDLDPEINLKFIKLVKKFQDAVEEDYSRTVVTNNEAKDTLLQLKNDFQNECSNIFPEELKFDISEYQITEWLLDCSLNFTRKL